VTDCRVAGRSAKCPMVWHSHAAFVGCSCPPCSAALPSLWGALRCAMLEIRRQLSAGCGRYSKQSFVPFPYATFTGKAKRKDHNTASVLKRIVGCGGCRSSLVLTTNLILLYKSWKMYKTNHSRHVEKEHVNKPGDTNVLPTIHI